MNQLTEGKVEGVVKRHPRVLGVSPQFQRHLLEYSPQLYEQLAKDGAVRRIFYLMVKNRASIDAFNARKTIYKDALAVAARNERQRKARGRKINQSRTDGVIALGRETRKRVKDAAMAYKQKYKRWPQDREALAGLLAPKVGKSVGHVLKLLRLEKIPY